jgi:hypothetical protein
MRFSIALMICCRGVITLTFVWPGNAQVLTECVEVKLLSNAEENFLYKLIITAESLPSFSPGCVKALSSIRSVPGATGVIISA